MATQYIVAPSPLPPAYLAPTPASFCTLLHARQPIRIPLMSANTIRVLLADDHPFMRVAYRTILEQHAGFEVVAEASNGREAYFRTYQSKPDVVIMDVTLPDISGIEITRKIVKRDPSARVLVSSMHKELVYAVRALKVGAGGYITKDCAPGLLTEAVSQVAAGETYLVPEIARKLAVRKFGGDDDPFHLLTPREFEVLMKFLCFMPVSPCLFFGYSS